MTSSYKEIIDFDTAYSTYANANSDCFDTVFYFNQPLQRVRRINLKAFEMINYIPNCRANTNTITFKLHSGSTTYTASLAIPNNYTSIASLISDLNTACTSLVPSTTITFSANSTSNIITCTTSGASLLDIQPSTLATYVLGFRSYTGTGTTTLVAAVPWNLAFDTYVYLYLKNIPVNRLTTFGTQKSFKVQLTSSFGGGQYLDENTSYVQAIDMADSGCNLTSMAVQVFDRFNNLLLVGNPDYSFSLEFEMER
jgi:hypothetical protein